MADSTKYSSYTEFIFRWNDDLKSTSSIIDTDENDRLYRIGSDAFYRCSSLNTADFPNCKYIGNSAFCMCSSLTNINLLNCKYIGVYAFTSCSSLISANFPKCSYIDANAFNGDNSLTTVSFPVCKYIGVYAFAFCKIKEANFPACTDINENAFYRNTVMLIANFPSCYNVGPDAFAECSALTTLNFPMCTSTSNGAFGWCSALTEVFLPKCTYLSQQTFCADILLNTVSLPVCSYIGASAFQACYNLLSLYLMSTSLTSLPYSNAFSSTPIAGYTTSTSGVYGSIYVPASLLASYKSATNWAYFSSRFACLVANLVLDGATENTIVTNGEEIVDTSSLYCDGTTLYAYNKDWGKVTIDNPMDTNVGTTVTKTITAPTDYITVTYSGISNTVSAAVKSITVSYEGISFTYDAFPVTLALPSTGAEVTLNATFTGYSKISRTDTISATTTITLSDPEAATYEIVDITVANAAEYATLVDGSNFIVNGDYITNGSVSYNVNNGHSKGYITFTTPPTIPDECNCVTIKCYASSENNWDFGYVYISASDTPTYASTYSNVKSATASSTLSGYITKSCGSNSSVSTFTSGTLAADTTYTLSFGYVKDSSGNSNSDRFFIQEIKFPKAS